MHIYIECQAHVQLRLFAIYSGYCRMHRVCAACLETVQPARSTIPTQHFQIGAVMSASMLGTCLVLAGVCCWLLSCCVVTACTGFVRKPTQPGTACWVCLTASTHANKHAYVHTCTSRFSTGQQPLSAGCSEYCRMHRVCATCHHSQVQPAASV
jgi:hypothetical protein